MKSSLRAIHKKINKLHSHSKATPIFAGKVGYFKKFINSFHFNVHSLNNNKFFAGVLMIMLNIGSKFITIQFSKSAEEYLKYSITKQLLVFSMAWIGTRDIYTALILTAIFTVLSDHLFNEESTFCVVPEKYRVLNKKADRQDELTLSEGELNTVIQIVEKVKKEKAAEQEKKNLNNYQL